MNPRQDQPQKTAEITVQATGWPKPGRKMGWLKSSEGQFYSIRPAMVNNFAKGEVCHVTYVEGDFKDDGTRWMTIVSKQAGAQGGPQQKVIPQVKAETNPREKKINFVMTMLGHVILPTDSLQSLQARGDQYKQLFDYLFGSAEKQKNDTRMNDEIPDGPPDFPEEGNWEPDR